MSTKHVFWRDVGAVFDRHFGYASLTYGKEELHGFFTHKLGVAEQPEAEQYADVWVRMSTAPQEEQKLIKGRLEEILPKLAEAVDIENPPDWWLQQREAIRVWTTAHQFVNPRTVFTPDDTFAEELRPLHLRRPTLPRRSEASSHLPTPTDKGRKTRGLTNLSALQGRQIRNRKHRLIPKLLRRRKPAEHGIASAKEKGGKPATVVRLPQTRTMTASAGL